jgi:hypothetical protein
MKTMKRQGMIPAAVLVAVTGACLAMAACVATGHSGGVNGDPPPKDPKAAHKAVDGALGAIRKDAATIGENMKKAEQAPLPPEVKPLVADSKARAEAIGTNATTAEKANDDAAATWLEIKNYHIARAERAEGESRAAQATAAAATKRAEKAEARIGEMNGRLYWSAFLICTGAIGLGLYLGLQGAGWRGWALSAAGAGTMVFLTVYRLYFWQINLLAVLATVAVLVYEWVTRTNVIAEVCKAVDFHKPETADARAVFNAPFELATSSASKGIIARTKKLLKIGKYQTLQTAHRGFLGWLQSLLGHGTPKAAATAVPAAG